MFCGFISHCCLRFITFVLFSDWRTKGRLRKHKMLWFPRTEVDLVCISEPADWGRMWLEWQTEPVFAFLISWCVLHSSALTQHKRGSVLLPSVIKWSEWAKGFQHKSECSCDSDLIMIMKYFKTASTPHTRQISQALRWVHKEWVIILKLHF